MMNKRSRVKITTVQMNVSYKNRSENIAIVRALLNGANSLGDVVLLPELFSTGYLFNEGFYYQNGEEKSEWKSLFKGYTLP